MIGFAVSVVLVVAGAVAAPDLLSWCLGAGGMAFVIWMATPPKF